MSIYPSCLKLQMPSVLDFLVLGKLAGKSEIPVSFYFNGVRTRVCL